MATFTKLRSGEWGVKVQGTAKAGQQVTVTKKGGDTKQVTIAKVVWSGKGVAICAIESSSGSAKKSRCCKYCGVEWYAGGFRRDGVCWDCVGEMQDGILGHSH